MRDSPWTTHYEAAAERIGDLYVSRVAPDLTVPACPEWTARDLLGHLAGLTEDWVAGNLDNYASPQWTARQVARCAGRPLEDVLDSWRAARGSFAELPASDVMGDPAMWALGDALVHEGDLHEALADGSRPPSEAVQLALKFAVSRWRAHLADCGIPSLLVDVVDARQYWCGEPDEGAPVLHGDAWEVTRALWGRRSPRQVGLMLRDSGGQVIEAGLPYPFVWSESPTRGLTRPACVAPSDEIRSYSAT